MEGNVIKRPVRLLLALTLSAGVGCAAPKAPVDPTPLPSAPPSAPSAKTSVYARTGPRDFAASVRDIVPRVYVPNSRSNTIHVIDPLTYKVIGHYAVGLNPQHITPSWDMKTLYVDNDRSNSLTPIDARTGKLGKPFPVNDPYNLYFTPDGKHAIVVAERMRHLDFRDRNTFKRVKSILIPFSGPNHLDFDATGRYLLVSCEFSGWVVRVDVKKMEITGKVYVGGKPTDVKLSPDGKVFYIANETRNGVSIVDGRLMKRLDFLKTGRGTHGFVVGRDGKLMYVSNRLGGSISVISFAQRRVIDTWNIGGSPDMGGVSADGKKLWLSGRYSGVVYVINTFTGKIIKTIRVDSGPHGVCVFPQPGRFSMGHTGAYR